MMIKFQLNYGVAVSLLVLSSLTSAGQSIPASTQTSTSSEIILPVASQGEYLGDVERPKRGQNQQTVESLFGQPLSSHGPSGEPAIIRWDYPDFSVYFENNAVIHSVLKHRRQDTAPNVNDSQ